MSLSLCIDAMTLPPGTRVDKRVPKRLLLEQSAAAVADRRKIQEGIEELFWVAALKPNNIGVLAFKDAAREYLEIAVLTVRLRDGAKASRIAELIHRAIPYPLVLWTEQGGAVSLSLAHKRWSQGGTGDVVIEDLRRTAPFWSNSPTVHEAAFLASLALSSLVSRDLYVLYEGWLDRVLALAVASISGTFGIPANAESARAFRSALANHTELQRRLVGLRRQAVKERQLNYRVELNLEIKRVEAAMTTIVQNMKARETADNLAHHSLRAGKADAEIHREETRGSI
jgi:hypothetical protein